MITIEDVIGMKEKDMRPFGTSYRWLFMTIEDYLISKFDGNNRVKQLLEDYDDQAKIYILHQFEKCGKYNIVHELVSIFGFENNLNILDEKYSKELLDNSEI